MNLIKPRSASSPDVFIQMVSDEVPIQEVVVSSGTRTWSKKFPQEVVVSSWTQTSSRKISREVVVSSGTRTPSKQFSSDKTEKQELVQNLFSIVTSEIKKLVHKNLKIKNPSVSPWDSYHILPYQSAMENMKDHKLRILIPVHVKAFNNKGVLIEGYYVIGRKPKK
jgi:hypothetical protein